MTRTQRSHPAARRASAAVLVGALAWLALAVLSVASRAETWPWVLALAVLGAAWIGCRVLIRDIAERRASEVDEYELLQRNRARNVGYLAALVAALVLYLVLSVATTLAERGGGTLLQQAHQLVLVAFLPAAALPTFWLAWRLRSAAADDPDDPDELDAALDEDSAGRDPRHD